MSGREYRGKTKNTTEDYYYAKNLFSIETMNLFLLAACAIEAATMHCDKHCIKMILETTQLLYTAWWFGREQVDWADCPYAPYRATHRNHPSAIWVRLHPSHYQWALRLGLALCEEYTRRYKKQHKCFAHLQRLKVMGYPPHVGQETFKGHKLKIARAGCPKGCDEFYCAINDEIFPYCATYTDGQLNAVETYRKYYATKTWALKWNRGAEAPPAWYLEAFQQKELMDNLWV